MVLELLVLRRLATLHFHYVPQQSGLRRGAGARAARGAARAAGELEALRLAPHPLPVVVELDKVPRRTCAQHDRVHERLPVVSLFVGRLRIDGKAQRLPPGPRRRRGARR